MGQAGAQREPSMEEILASIRKIIETNDKGGASAGARENPMNGVAPVEAEKPAVAAMPSRSAEIEDDAADAADVSDDGDGDGEFVAQAAPAPGNAEKSMEDGDAVSLADIAARMRGKASGPVGTVLGDEVVQELQDMLAGEAHGEVDAQNLKSKASREAAEGLEEVARELARMETEKSSSKQGFAGVPDDDAETVTEPQAAADTALDEEFDAALQAELEDDEPEADPVASSDRVDQERQLISVGAEEKVAQSFAALNAIMSSGPQRSFDEIAEDLLRPMLQNWLDDNLPTLVERLVREEIERVSRGNRR